MLKFALCILVGVSFVAYPQSLPFQQPRLALRAAGAGMPAYLQATFGDDTASIPARNAGEDIRSYMARAAAAGFSGEILAAIGDSVVLNAAYGVAIPSASVPYDTATPTYIGSLTKQFTAAAVLRLAEQRRLRLTDPIARFFPRAPRDKARITLHQLLTHSAGFPDSVGERYGSSPITRDAMIRRILGAPLDSTRGTWSYSNPGYVMLAAIVEIASGRRYEDYLRAELFRPAGLSHTGYVLPAEQMRRVAHARNGTADLGAPRNRGTWMSDGPTWALRGAGGMVSTAGDLFRWYTALRSGKVLNEVSVKKLFSEQIAEDSSRTSFYGYGWEIVPATKRGKVIGHNGSDGSYYGALVNFVDRGPLVIVLTNQQRPGFRRVEAGLTGALFEILATSAPPKN